MLSLQELREKNNAQVARASGNSTSPSVFNFRDLKAGDSVRVRFIDDTGPNDTFWREKRIRIFQFPNVIDSIGETYNQTAYVEVPAFNTKYNESMLSNPPAEYVYKSEDDVIQKRISGFWDDTEAGRSLYSKFSRKKSYVFRGFLESDVEGYERNKVYRFIINEELFQLIKSFLSNMEIDVIPTNVDNGLDFIINVTSKQASINGVTQEVKAYSTSTWARKETPLTDAEKKYLAENTLDPLLTYIPERPTSEQERVMVEMFDACMNGESYDVRKWGSVFKPNNVQFDADGKVKAEPGKVTNVKPTYTYDTVKEETKVVESVPVKAEVVEEKPETTVRVTELINEHKEEVTSQDPKALINDIMAKYKIQK